MSTAATGSIPLHDLLGLDFERPEAGAPSATGAPHGTDEALGAGGALELARELQADAPRRAAGAGGAPGDPYNVALLNDRTTKGTRGC